ncbi:EamA family transporter [Neobacillus piezotolerans]|uniref:EamA family transporter n=1 Tax=Neobacillus piezotolerans TaxID=2259171 RepID=A0A3D8GNA4_9BACI|nr:EamA family transporter [Neobacillus piezotolerans]RDU35960.1 EamA family transporter [Neobacillus piezotolerans]
MKAEQLALQHVRAKGIALVLIGATLWGISGTVAQYLFQRQGFSPAWLVDIRLLLAGSILLAIGGAKDPAKIFRIWKSVRDAVSLLVFSILGMLAVQYTYFAAIDHSNAAAATVLQYLAPTMIAAYLAITERKLPNRWEISAVILALAGTLLLVTKGNIGTLSISGLAVFWGIASAAALAFYTLQPRKLLEKWGAVTVTGWGMATGGLCFSFINPPWIFEGTVSFQSMLAVLFVVIFGTLIAFYCYLESLKYISASETSLLASVEPLSAAFVSVLWLNVSFGLEEWLGTFCIISTIVILAKKRT